MTDKIKIVSDGTGIGTRITYKDVLLPIRSFRINCDGPERLVEVTLDSRFTELDVTVYPEQATIFVNGFEVD